MIDKFCLFTNDIETISIWYNSLRIETAHNVVKKGLPLLLDIYDKYDIKTTFFVTGTIAKLYPEIIKIILERGHEVGSHGLSHERMHGFDILSYEDQIYHLVESKKILEDIGGKEVISFRAPALRVSKNTATALEESGYKIDSSIASQRFDMFMSMGGLKKMRWLTAPRLPYRPSSNNIFKRGHSKIIEVPLTAFGLPYLGTTMRLFPRITDIQKLAFDFEASLDQKPIVFIIHPNEFIDESDKKRIIEKRSVNPFSSFFQDTIRSKLKINNLGPQAIPLYENQIKFFKEKHYNFLPLRDYVKKTRL